MTVTVFAWKMFKYRPGEGVGVGHAALSISGNFGSIYVSFWPAAHNLKSGLYSEAKLHFMNGDKKADGTPDWASKPIEDLNEERIIQWWSRTQPNCLLDFKNRTDFMKTGEVSAAKGSIYNIVANQCSTTVVRALIEGASSNRKAAIIGALGISHGTGAGVISLPTITPQDVRNLVASVWGD
ncbi:hypothetical protein [Methylobacterium symbioticum]|uniref:hypothetical protein n=1 Tax=Methylobacterium symbioticum TaxID=2584084 RepID=UPI0011573452|nr:hypothetical protein [Methylobacterium symbioticum]